MLKKFVVKLICWIFKDKSIEVAYDVMHKYSNDILDTDYGIPVTRLFRSSYRLLILSKNTLNYEKIEKYTLLSHELNVSKRTIKNIEDIIKEP